MTCFTTFIAMIPIELKFLHLIVKLQIFPYTSIFS